ncbi:MAG: UDP-N-acetylmuramoyl-tripeptide--D-alanyl-D-alanine ligase [Clostridia bacterium]|nr:UDP-N-acetylmuramoyl-tripeptide--D-alanyl-D-alanine ligase [Clostridia bacterium]
MLPLTVEDVCCGTRGRLLSGDGSLKIQGISTDTRTLKPGEVFFALKGPRFDGHDFLEIAAARGAAAAVISRRPEGAAPPALVLVPDTLQALQSLAAWYRGRFNLPVIGVTGSSGKTTTKDLIAAVLGRFGPVLKTPGNFNNEIGLPLTLLQLDKGYRVAVLEMAMRAPGEIAALCRLARPDIGVITNIGAAHLGRLGSKEAIARAKGELLAALPRTGLAVLNADDAWCRRLALSSPARVIFYGFSPEAEVRVRDVAASAGRDSKFGLEVGGRLWEVALPMPGRHNVLNAAAALAVAWGLGLDLDEAIPGLKEWPAEDLRQNFIAGPNGSLIFNDAYNANPDSMLAALRVLSELQGERRLAVLGDMLELGPEAARLHFEVGEAAAGLGLAYLITVGSLARELASGARAGGMPAERIACFDDHREAAARLRELLRPGDVVLVKGSRGMAMEKVLTALGLGEGN